VYEWIIYAFHSKHSIGRFHASREEPDRPRAKRRGVVKKDLQRMGFAWEEAEVGALDRQEWRQNVAQCVHTDAG